MTASPLPIGWWTSGIQSSGLHSPPAAAGVLDEDEGDLGHGQRVAGLQPRGGRIGHSPGGPVPAHLGPLRGELHAVRGREPHPRPSGLRQGDAVDQPLGTQPGQPPPGLLDTHLGRGHPVHLVGGGHPVLRQHAQRHPVSAARVHADHHGSARFPSGATPSCPASRVPVTAAVVGGVVKEEPHAVALVHLVVLRLAQAVVVEVALPAVVGADGDFDPFDAPGRLAAGRGWRMRSSTNWCRRQAKAGPSLWMTMRKAGSPTL